jgi:hypothetical protein
MVLGDLVQMAECAKRRVARLDTQITTQLEQSPLASLWWALQSLRGLSTVSASVRVAALGDLSRCAHPRQLMAYAGLTPSEHSSGGRHQRGGITKTGNTAVRRVLGEMAWHYRHQPALGVRLRACQRDQPAAIVAISWQAQTRLHPRFLRLIFRGKLKQQAVVAIARELLGVIWEIATIVRHQSQDQRTALAEPSTADWQVAEPADEQGPGRSVLGPPLAVGANPSPRL